MSPEEAEIFYDAEIAPALAAIGENLKAAGMPFLATVEYAPGDRGTTYVQTPEQGLEMDMLGMLDRARGNLDAFVIGVKRHCARKGISTDASVALTTFGRGITAHQSATIDHPNRAPVAEASAAERGEKS